MPLYEYECKSCSKQVEILVSNPSAKPECPECGSKQLTKLLSVVAAPVVQKGTGSRNEENCGRPQCAGGGCMFRN